MRLMLDVASPTLSRLRVLARQLGRSTQGHTTNEVLAHLNKDWQTDVRAFDEVHILHMAAGPSDGIVKQFAHTFL